MTQGNLPEAYQKIVLNRHENASDAARRVFDNFSEKLSIQSTAYSADKTPHYLHKPSNGCKIGVYYNAGDDMQNKRGAGSTYYHELAHMIDHAAMDFQSFLSDRPEFYEALMHDAQNVLNHFERAGDNVKAAFIAGLRKNNRTHSVQDLLDAATHGKICIGWGHEPQYWQTSGNLQKEAFAHFFEASMGADDKVQYLRYFFPTAFNVFDTMLEDIAPKEKTLEKKLVRRI